MSLWGLEYGGRLGLRAAWAFFKWPVVICAIPFILLAAVAYGAYKGLTGPRPTSGWLYEHGDGKRRREVVDGILDATCPLCLATGHGSTLGPCDYKADPPGAGLVILDEDVLVHWDRVAAALVEGTADYKHVRAQFDGNDRAQLDVVQDVIKQEVPA